MKTPEPQEVELLKRVARESWAFDDDSWERWVFISLHQRGFLNATPVAAPPRDDGAILVTYTVNARGRLLIRIYDALTVSP